MIVDVALDRPALLERGELESLPAARVTQAEFETFYRETARPFWGYLARICGDRALADDLLQESYLRFCRARVPASRGDWKSYLYRIGTNLAADWWRHAGRRPSTSAEAEPEPSTGDRGGEAAAIRRRDLAVDLLNAIQVGRLPSSVRPAGGRSDGLRAQAKRMTDCCTS